MKNLLLLAFAALALTACDDKDNNNDNNGLPAGYTYATTNDLVDGGRILNDIDFFGTSQVSTTMTPQAAPFVDEKAHFELTTTSSEGTSTLYMHATRFAAAMPAVEMRLLGVPVAGSGKSITFAAERIIPENFIAAANQWVRNEKYAITDIEGRIDNTLIEITFTCAGMFKVSYSGKLITKN